MRGVFPFWKSPVGLMMCYPASWIMCILFLGTARIIAEKKLKKEFPDKTDEKSEAIC